MAIVQCKVKYIRVTTINYTKASNQIATFEEPSRNFQTSEPSTYSRASRELLLPLSLWLRGSICKSFSSSVWKCLISVIGEGARGFSLSLFLFRGGGISSPKRVPRPSMGVDRTPFSSARRVAFFFLSFSREHVFSQRRRNLARSLESLVEEWRAKKISVVTFRFGKLSFGAATIRS